MYSISLKQVLSLKSFSTNAQGQLERNKRQMTKSRVGVEERNNKTQITKKQAAALEKTYQKQRVPISELPKIPFS